MNGMNADSRRYAPGIPHNINPLDTQTFLVLAGFRAPATTVPQGNPGVIKTLPSSRNTVIDTLMEAELLLQELEEQPKDQDDQPA